MTKRVLLAAPRGYCAGVDRAVVTVEKALDIFEKLKLDGVSSDPKHASPVEHQATPMDDLTIPFNPNTWENGITHVRRDGSLWSGNLRGWVQYRQLIPNESVWD